MKTVRYIQQSIAVILTAVLCFCFVSCEKEKKARVNAVADRAAIPMLTADTVTTLISDSGVTRYRIKTPKWEVYDKAEPPYWEFTKGIFLERFNEELETESSLVADYAHYNEDAQIWHLTGNVHAVNLEGEQFDTPELYWNQKTEKVYSDSSIVITKQTSIIKGVGFRSNQEMTKYTILNPTGVFPIKDEDSAEDK